jgi:hypothetical protein
MTCALPVRVVSRHVRAASAGIARAADAFQSIGIVARLSRCDVAQPH